MRREIVVIGAVLTAAVLAVDLLFYSHTTEDAYITFRYSEHLAEGFGFGAWNESGERVEGYTPTLWMLVLSAAPWLGIRIETLAKALGVVSQLALCWLLLLYPLGRLGRIRSAATRDSLLGADRDVYTIAAIGVGLYWPACWYATSGMEAMSFGLLVGLALLAPILTERASLTALVYAALVAMRPEGALVGAVFGGLHLALARVEGRSLHGSIGALSGWAVMLVALTGFRLAVFGEWVPNTWFAKTAGSGALHLRLGVEYVSDWAVHHVFWWIGAACAAVAVVISLRRDGVRAQLGIAAVAGLALIYAVYVLRVGGDNPSAFPWWRQFLHVGPVFALIVGFGICGVTRNRKIRFAFLAASVAVTQYQILGAQHGKLAETLRDSVSGYPRLQHESHNPFYLWLARISEPDTVIASATAGELPFVVDAHHIDMLGLNDREIAHSGSFDRDGPVDSKSDIDSVMRRRPDIIQSTLRTGRFEKVSPRGNRILHRGEMEAALLSHPTFVRDYLYLRNAPYESRDRALFLHRDFWTSHPERDLMTVVPVRETAIYPKQRK